MINYLLLCVAVVCCSIQSIISKQYNVKVKNINSYLYCAMTTTVAMMFFLIASRGMLAFERGVLFYSILFAVCYSMATIGNLCAIACGPLGISSLLFQCSLVIPTLYGLVVLKERLSIFGYIGIVCLFVCLFMVNPIKKDEEKKIGMRWGLWVAVGFVGNGMCSAVQKMQQLKFDGAYKNEFMIVALLCSAAVMYLLGFKHGKKLKSEFCSGIKYAVGQGAANGATNMLVMILTAILPTAVLFPAVLSGGIIITFAASVAVYKEKLSLMQYVGYFLGIAAVVLINL